MRGRENYFKASDYDRYVVGCTISGKRPRVAPMKFLKARNIVGAGFLLALVILVTVHSGDC
jgi:hypothetical protein